MMRADPAIGESRPAALCIAVLGAESTGKTTLAQALQAHLAQSTGMPVAWVPEVLREWCARMGRTPLAHEQGPLMRAQHERIDAAAAAHAVVISDTTAVMTAVYSRLIFGDGSLEDRAVALHRRMHLTLVTALDLPWQADGLMRDGPQVQGPVDTLLRSLLLRHRVAFSLVGGSGPARLAQALAAVEPVLRKAGLSAAGGSGPAGPETPRTSPPTRPPRRAGTGWLTGLAQGHRDAAAAARWQCECCVDPAAERAELSRAVRP